MMTPEHDRQARPHRVKFWITFLVFIAVDTALLIPLLIAPANPWVITGYTVLMPAMILWIMFSAMRWLWNPVMAVFPPVEPAEESMSRKFQSFSLGLLNLSMSVHATVDADYLHLQLAGYLRFLGATNASIPWSVMGPPRPGFLGSMTVMVNGSALSGPKWCLAVNDPDGKDDPPADDV
jgi:hypothetical protein